MSNKVYLMIITTLVPLTSIFNPVIFLISDWKISKKLKQTALEIKQ